MVKVYVDDICTGPRYYPEIDEDDSDWIVVRSVENAKVILSQLQVTHLSMDHDMGEGMADGYDLVKWLVETKHFPTEYIIIHSANPVGVENMKGYLSSAHKAMPELGLDKLCNWIK